MQSVIHMRTKLVLKCSKLPDIMIIVILIILNQGIQMTPTHLPGQEWGNASSSAATHALKDKLLKMGLGWARTHIYNFLELENFVLRRPIPGRREQEASSAGLALNAQASHSLYPLWLTPSCWLPVGGWEVGRAGRQNGLVFAFHRPREQGRNLEKLQR